MSATCRPSRRSRTSRTRSGSTPSSTIRRTSSTPNRTPLAIWSCSSRSRANARSNGSSSSSRWSVMAPSSRVGGCLESAGDLVQHLLDVVGLDETAQPGDSGPEALDGVGELVLRPQPHAGAHLDGGQGGPALLQRGAAGGRTAVPAARPLRVLEDQPLFDERGQGGVHAPGRGPVDGSEEAVELVHQLVPVAGPAVHQLEEDEG